jgi:hypothetical protein
VFSPQEIPLTCKLGTFIKKGKYDFPLFQRGIEGDSCIIDMNVFKA